MNNLEFCILTSQDRCEKVVNLFSTILFFLGEVKPAKELCSREQKASDIIEWHLEFPFAKMVQFTGYFHVLLNANHKIKLFSDY